MEPETGEGSNYVCVKQQDRSVLLCVALEPFF